MSDETFAAAAMRRLRELEAENAKLRRENERLRKQAIPLHPPYSAIPTWEELSRNRRGPRSIMATVRMTPEGEALIRRMTENGR